MRILRIASAILPLVLATASGQAQQVSDDAVVPEICLTASGETLSDLQKRRQQLEREVAANPNLRKSQEELLEVIFRIECLSGTQPVVSPQFRRGPGPHSASTPVAPGEVIEITTYYATNRVQGQSSEPAKLYTSQVGDQLNYGRAKITVPSKRTPGTVTLPKLWKLEREADPRKHFILRAVEPVDADAARKELVEKLQTSNAKSLLVFVHGYNTSFREAAMRTAQMAYDLQFPGLALFFSWPSASSVIRYWQDEEAAQLSEGILDQMLDDLSKLPATDIYIVAHSMGNRIVGQALQSRRTHLTQLREVLLAAPDVNVDIFRTRMAPKLATMRGTRTTIYAASSDIALKASKIVHGFRRVGETIGGVFTYPGLETIDASSAASATRAYGHLYIMDSPSVLKDIRTIIERNQPPGQRGLSEMGSLPNQYWRFP
jgi:esterase/lipase superfamily enzyme